MGLSSTSLLPLHTLDSTVILCSFIHLFPSFLPMLPVVHRGAGSAPKQAESQWGRQSSADSQSHLNLSTAEPPFLLFFFCFHFVLALSFNPISCFSSVLHLFFIRYICVFSPSSYTANFLPSVYSQTHCFWTGLTLDPVFWFLCSPFLFSLPSEANFSL